MSDAELWLIVWRDICAVLASRRRGCRNREKSQQDRMPVNGPSGVARPAHPDYAQYMGLKDRICRELRSIYALNPDADLDQLILDGLRVARPER